jgi:hypothetical protein
LTRSQAIFGDLASHCGDPVTFGTTQPVAHDLQDPLTSLNTKLSIEITETCITAAELLRYRL